MFISLKLCRATHVMAYCYTISVHLPKLHFVYTVDRENEIINEAGVMKDVKCAV